MSFTALRVIVPALIAASVSIAQAPSPAFEVATIRPSGPDAQGKYGGMRGTQFLATNFTIAEIISVAYDVHPTQILHGPDWLSSEHFDIAALPGTRQTPTTEGLQAMIQRLLADRFSLAFHKERKELDVYAVTLLGSERHKLKPTESSEALPNISANYGSIQARNARVSDLIRTLQRNILNRPVQDRTGLTDRFDFSLSWAPDEFQYPDRVRQATPGDGPSIFKAFEEQLGLQLRTMKAPAEVFVIDRIQRPSEN